MSSVGSVSKARVSPAAAPHARFFFESDSHDGYGLLDRFVSRTNAQRPDFVLSGGDLSEVGSAKEQALLTDHIAPLKVPFRTIPGNHDYRGDAIGRFEAEFGNGNRSFDQGGVHFTLIDDASQKISDQTFNFLEKDLAANEGKPTVVAMHVPAVWESTPGWVKALHKLMPDTIANFRIEDPAQRQRFTDLMSRHNVQLVLSGHTHVPGDATVGGVRYVTAGALGGKLDKIGVAHEYLDVSLADGKVDVRHVALDNPIKGVWDLVKSNARYLVGQFSAMDGKLPDAVAKLPDGIKNIPASVRDVPDKAGLLERMIGGIKDIASVAGDALKETLLHSH